MELTTDLVLLGLAWFVVFLFSTTLHEAAHAFIALRLGDPTAYQGGQVTLNPVPHVRREPFGMVVVPIVSFFMGGWMFGWASAPYDPNWALRHPRRAAWMALGGPAANLLLVIVAGLLVRVGIWAGYFYAPEAIRFSSVTGASDLPGAAGVATVLSVMFTLNLVLFIFNLLPLPPLDGSGVVQLLMSDELARRYQAFLRQPMLAWVGILIAWRLFGPIFRPLHVLALGLLYPGAGYQ